MSHHCRGAEEKPSTKLEEERIHEAVTVPILLMAVDKMRPVVDGEAEPVVIGGMVLDINGIPSTAANPRTTTPGKVVYELGGVARNVAECMAKLGAKPYMISALGFDFAGSLLLEHWRSAGLSEAGIRKSQDIQTAVVNNIFDGKGEVAAGVASVESIEMFVTPEWIRKFKANVYSAPLLLVDANLSPPALVASCQLAAECGTPIWFEPVSVIKSKRVASIAKYITYTSPNEDELIAMANSLSPADRFQPIKSHYGTTKFSIEPLFQKLNPPTRVLLDKGIKVVFVTLGPHGVLLCFNSTHKVEKANYTQSRTSTFSRKLYEDINVNCPPGRILGSSKLKGSCYIAVHFPALSASVVRVTGAGDCLVGGIIAALCAGLDIIQSVAVGIAAAKGAVESEKNVPKEYELTKIADDARTVYSGAKVVFFESKL